MAWSAQQAVDGLSAAGEPTRLRILALLSRDELAVMELSQILDQSQPRVSRHLKLLAEAGLVERFPDGSWVFYRIAGHGPGGALARAALDALDAADPQLKGDAERLEGVRRARHEAAQAYFARNAARWDDIRSLYVSETDVEAAILRAAGEGPFSTLIDLGTGAGRMLQLLAPRAQRALGLDLSQQMLNIARANTAASALNAELRHGDIRSTGLPSGIADLVVVHQVLHYLNDPGAAGAEAARLVGPEGRLLIVDFAPHEREELRVRDAHLRLGFADEAMLKYLDGAGLRGRVVEHLEGGELTVTLWEGERPQEKLKVVA